MYEVHAVSDYKKRPYKKHYGNLRKVYEMTGQSVKFKKHIKTTSSPFRVFELRNKIFLKSVKAQQLKRFRVCQYQMSTGMSSKVIKTNLMFSSLYIKGIKGQ